MERRYFPISFDVVLTAEQQEKIKSLNKYI